MGITPRLDLNMLKSSSLFGGTEGQSAQLGKTKFGSSGSLALDPSQLSVLSRRQQSAELKDLRAIRDAAASALEDDDPPSKMTSLHSTLTVVYPWAWVPTHRRASVAWTILESDDFAWRLVGEDCDGRRQPTG